MSICAVNRSHYKLALTATCTLILAGCANYRGLAPHSSLLNTSDIAAQETLKHSEFSKAAFPNPTWWNALGDPQLDAIINEALTDNPSLAAADARQRQAMAQVSLSKAQNKPTLDATGQYSGLQLPLSAVGDELGGKLMWRDILMLNFSWALDLWGGQRAAYESAVGQARAAEIDAQAARLKLSTNIARTYIALSQAYELLDVALREQDRSSHLRDLSQQRVDAGIDNDLQLRQAESAIARALQQQYAAQQQVDALRNAIAALLGKGPDRGLQITRPQLLDAPVPALPDALPSELLGHRADIVAARWRVEAASRNIDAHKATFKPSINLMAITGVTSESLSDLFKSDALFGLGSPAISLPIFEGGRLRANLKGANAQYDLAVADYNNTVISAMKEVVNTVQAARSLDGQVASLSEARNAVQKALELASSRYEAGLGTQLDVLSAQQPLLQLDQQLVDLHAQRYTAVVDLDQALGGGLSLVAPETISTNTTDASTP